ncbi:MAG: 4Fe-4S binding protein [Thermodesulfobacteriota bacterium]
MPPKVDIEKCDGCKAQAEPLCEQICPGDLMTLGPDRKAFCRSLRDCWDCMSCTKVCPVGAIETRIPYQLGYFGAKLTPMVGANSITWTAVDINGKVERFRYKTRTT